MAELECKIVVKDEVQKGVKRKIENCEEKPKKRLQCLECNAFFEKQKHLTRHMRKHNGDTFDCPECDKKFFRKDHLKRHLASHAKERPFKCDYPNCNSCFKTQDHLIRHKKWHVQKKKKLKQYKCVKCNLTFKKKSALKKHNVQEHGALPYPCVHCDAAFERPQDRKKHVKEVHAAPSIKCEDCGEMFRWFRELTEHRKLFHANFCKICQRVFHARSSLLEHYKTHYDCPECDFVATTAEGCVMHFNETEHGLPFFLKEMASDAEFEKEDAQCIPARYVCPVASNPDKKELA